MMEMKRSDKILLAVIAGLIPLWLFCVSWQRGDGGSRLCINEVLPLSDSMLVDLTNIHEEWIEIYNGTDQALDLTGYGLSDSEDDPLRWCFPAGTKIDAKDYLVVYTTGAPPGEEGLYSSFSLSKSGETVVLAAPDGTLLDMFSYGRSFSNRPYGRTGKQGAVAVLGKATPGKENLAIISRLYQAEKTRRQVCFSKESGSYASEFALELSAPAGGTILYTLDSSDPNLNSMVYKQPILIDNRSAEENQFANRKASPDKTTFTYRGIDPVKKATVVKARIFQDGKLSDNIEVKTYFVGHEDGIMRISLTADPDALFDDEDGIYVPGDIYSFFTHTRPNDEQNKPLGNFSVTGKAGERRANAAFFAANGNLLLEQDTGLRISGGLGSSASAAKSLRIYASSQYGKNRFDFPHFTMSEIDQTAFKQLQIRSNANFYDGIFEDTFTTTLFLGQDMGVQAYVPAVLYLNGEFWGLTAVRERVDEEFVEDHFGIHKENLTMLKSSHDEAVKMQVAFGSEQDQKEYLGLFEYASTQDISTDEAFAYLADRIDMQNLIRSYLARIFCANRDWPDNNLRAFRSKELGKGKFEDGKWRYLFYDMDFSFEDYKHNTLQFALGNEPRGYFWEGDDHPDEWSLDLFQGLMQNKQFRDQFLAQYNEYRRTIFQPEYLKARLDQMLGELGPLIEEHADRWEKKTDPTKLPSLLRSLFMGEYSEREQTAEMQKKLYDFAENRLSYLDRFMQETYASYGDSILLE